MIAFAFRIFVLSAGLALCAETKGGFTAVQLDFTHHNSATSQKYLPETMGGGVAVLDYDNDGLLDIFVVNGGRITDPQPSPVDFARRKPEYWNRLYRQLPGRRFVDVTEKAGLAEADNSYGMGVAVADYDNDGDADIYITNYGRNELYRNEGNGTFRNVTKEAGVGAGGWSVSAGFFDFDNDGLLDLFVSRYLDWDFSRSILCGTPFAAYCRPDKFSAIGNLLFRNEGGGRFRDVSESSGIAAVAGKGMGIAFNDYDADGFPDVFVSNDGMEQFLFRNRDGKGFEECALAANVALSGDGTAFAGMGVAFQDYDNDGRPDIAVTNLALEKFALFRNDDGQSFSYTTLSSGWGSLTARSSGWGIGMVDFDNDGWKDLVAAQSHVLDNVEKIRPDLRYREKPGVYRNAGGKFTRMEMGDLPAVAARGAAFGDLDNDGAVDVVISVLGSHPVILWNTPTPNRSAMVKLVGVKTNRDGQGAKVRAGKQWHYATTSGSYLSASDPRIRIGLGQESEIAVEVFWPSGRRQIVDRVPAGRVTIIREPQ